MLELAHVSKTFSVPPHEVRAVEDISLTVAPKEMVALQGPSGCGKTTILLISGALLRPTGGTVIVAKSDPYSFPADRRSRFRASTIGFVFQQFHLIPYLNVLQNIMAPDGALSHSDPRQRANELVRHFNLEQRAHHLPSQLSTGERQRVALARALFNKPKLVLADEPTGNLDPENSATVLDALAEYADAGNAVFLVTHSPEASKRAHRVVRINDGRIVGQAQVREAGA